MLAAFALAVVGALAFVNGANDVSKGVAPLVGSGVAGYRRAIAWGTAWTTVGAVLGAAFAGAMLATFGKGLLAEGITPGLGGAFAALLGAAGWVALATRTGLPVSTTHAIVGAIIGATVAGPGPSAVAWSAVGGKIVVPLLLSPAVAFALTAALERLLRASTAPGRPVTDCLCAGVESDALVDGTAGQVTLGTARLRLKVTTGTAVACAVHQPAAARVTFAGLQWLGSAATSLARGMNDAPKMVALGMGATALGATGVMSPTPLFLAVALGMAAGGLLAGRKVTALLAERVTPIDAGAGLAASWVTALLVTGGAVYGLPMSTTHVASGGITGAGAMRGTVNWATVRQMALAWVVTLPASALVAALGRLAAGALNL